MLYARSPLLFNTFDCACEVHQTTHEIVVSDVGALGCPV